MQSKGNVSCISKDILIKLNVHHPTSYSITFHDLPSYGAVGTILSKYRQSKGNNSCISETTDTNFDHYTIARYIITISFL